MGDGVGRGGEGGGGVKSHSGITRLIRANHLRLESHDQFLEDGVASERGPPARAPPVVRPATALCNNQITARGQWSLNESIFQLVKHSHTKFPTVDHRSREFPALDGQIGRR